MPDFAVILPAAGSGEQPGSTRSGAGGEGTGHGGAVTSSLGAAAYLLIPLAVVGLYLMKRKIAAGRAAEQKKRRKRKMQEKTGRNSMKQNESK